MNKKNFFLLIALSILSIGAVSAQIMPSIKRASISEKDKAILDEHLSRYEIFTIDKEEIVENLISNGYCQFQIRINEEMGWSIELEFNDMRAPEFRQTYTTDEGVFESKEIFRVNTFKGKTSDNRIARFTIDDNIFLGVILGDREHYVIYFYLLVQYK